MTVRLNKFIAQSSSLSRRAADSAIEAGRVTVNGKIATTGLQVEQTDIVCLNGILLKPPAEFKTIIFNKPVGYVCSRDGQGSKTIYDILPEQYRQLNPIGRLDKYSSGLLLLTNDGQLAQELTHPKYQKTKIYEITLDKPLQPLHQQMISDFGVTLEDGRSQFLISLISETDSVHRTDASEKRAGESGLTMSKASRHPMRGEPLSNHGKKPSDDLYQITMTEGRNRQIRRTFSALGYRVTSLHRTEFGAYHLGDLAKGYCQQIDNTKS